MNTYRDEFQAVQAHVQLQNAATAQNDGVTAQVRVVNHSTISDDGDATAAEVVKKGAGARGGSNAAGVKRPPATPGLPQPKKAKKSDVNDDAALESVLSGHRPPAVVPGTPAFRPGFAPATPAAAPFVVPGLMSFPGSVPGTPAGSAFFQGPVPATPSVGASPSAATEFGDLDNAAVSGDKVDIRAVLNGAKLGRSVAAVSFCFTFFLISLSMLSAGLCVWAELVGHYNVQFVCLWFCLCRRYSYVRVSVNTMSHVL